MSDVHVIALLRLNLPVLCFRYLIGFLSLCGGFSELFIYFCVFDSVMSLAL